MAVILNFKQILDLRGNHSNAQQTWVEALWDDHAKCHYCYNKSVSHEFNPHSNFAKCGICGDYFSLLKNTIIQGTAMPTWKYLAVLYVIYFFRERIDTRDILNDLAYKGDYVIRRRNRIDKMLPENTTPMEIRDITVTEKNRAEDLIDKYECGPLDLSLLRDAIWANKQKPPKGKNPASQLPF